MADSSIEWTDKVWNPVRGCVKVSAGCKNCYAETFAERWRGVKGHPYEQGFDLRLVPEKLEEPLRWQKPARIFVNSMSDLFQEDVPDEFIAAVFGIMAMARHHTFQILTKRAERAERWFRWAQDFRKGEAHGPIGMIWTSLCESDAPFSAKRFPDDDEGPDVGSIWPLPNVWLGVSVENQEQADARIPLLLKTPAAVRWISAEPLLGRLDLMTPAFDGAESFSAMGGLNWVVVGGESGHGARPFDLAWARSIVEQCRNARTAVFVKQMGANPTDSDLEGADPEEGKRFFKDKKGGDPREWPDDLRIREFPIGINQETKK